MSEFTIHLSGIRASGKHGVHPQEKVTPQEYIVDIDATVEVQLDAIEATADYVALAQTTREVIEDESFELVETLAAAIAQAVWEEADAVMQVAVTVYKPRAAEYVGVDDVSVEAVFPPPSDGTEL
ncbi:MAG: dihydroneopterin aldolase [Actinomycetota bacterium]